MDGETKREDIPRTKGGKEGLPWAVLLSPQSQRLVSGVKRANAVIALKHRMLVSVMSLSSYNLSHDFLLLFAHL